MKLTPLLLAALLPLSASAGMLDFLRGDGGGVNGPDLRGTAIPVAMDGVVTIDDTIRASQICYQTGAPERGVVSLSQKISQMLYGSAEGEFPAKNVKVRNRQYSFPRYSIPVAGSLELGEENKFEFSADFPDNKNDLFSSPFTTDPDGTKKRIFFSNGTISVKKGTASATLLLGNTLPIFGFGGIDTICDSYDELGNCINPRQAPHELMIIRGTAEGEAVALVNRDSHQKSALVINTEEVAQCLATEIRRLAQ